MMTKERAAQVLGDFLTASGYGQSDVGHALQVALDALLSAPVSSSSVEEAKQRMRAVIRRYSSRETPAPPAVARS